MTRTYKWMYVLSLYNYKDVGIMDNEDFRAYQLASELLFSYKIK